MHYSTLRMNDPEIWSLIEAQSLRRTHCVNLIASENIASADVCAALSSSFTDKYAEGYPKKRYYNGCIYADDVEEIAISRLCTLFGCAYANVQAHSGSQANQAVFLALLAPGDKVLGLNLASGGHLTHGASVSISGKWFEAHHYDVDSTTMLIDMNQVEDIAKRVRPRLIIAGASAYSRVLDFKAFREIADHIDCTLLADIAHYAGLIAGGAYPSPFPHAHVVTATTHKTLRGPRGAVVMTNDVDLIRKINFAVFPGLQGGPFMNVIAAKAVAFREALSPSFADYARNVVLNAQGFARALQNNGFKVVSGGTDSHMFSLDLCNMLIKGNLAANLLESAGIICNKNTIPFDSEPPWVTSGVRLGTAAETSMGMCLPHFHVLANIIHNIIINQSVSESALRELRDLLSSVREVMPAQCLGV